MIQLHSVIAVGIRHNGRVRVMCVLPAAAPLAVAKKDQDSQGLFQAKLEINLDLLAPSVILFSVTHFSVSICTPRSATQI